MSLPCACSVSIAALAATAAARGGRLGGTRQEYESAKVERTLAVRVELIKGTAFDQAKEKAAKLRAESDRLNPKPKLDQEPEPPRKVASVHSQTD